MKKLFNFRPSVFFLASFAGGIAIGYTKVKYGDALFYACLIAGALTCAAAFLPIKPLAFLSGKKFHAIAFLIAFLTGTGLFSLTFFNFEGNYDGQLARVECDISDSYPASGGGYFVGKNALIFIGEKSIREASIFVYVSGGSNLPSSGRMKFSAPVSANRILREGRINSYAYRNGFKYSFFISEGEYEVEEARPLLFSFIRLHIKRALYSGLSEENAGICYGLVVGDSAYMDDELLEAFGRAGIAHIFSVSGLHISVLSLALIYLLRLMRAGDRVQLAVVTAALLFYGGICRFSPSVVRAFLMTEFFLLSKVAGRRYDPLSSLSMSALLILIFSPLMLFDAGFLLSYSSVLGIFLLNDRLGKALSFLPRFVRQAASISLSAQAGMLPVAAHYLNSVSLISLLLNVTLIPLVNACYIALLALLPISWLPFSSFLFAVPQWGIELVKLATMHAAKVPFASAYVNGVGIGVAIAFYSLLAVCSKYLFLEKRLRRSACCALALLFAASWAPANLPFFARCDSVSALPGMPASFITSGGKVYLLSYGRLDAQKLDEQAKKHGISSLEAVFFTDYGFACDAITQLERYGVKKYVLPYGTKRQEELAALEAEGRVKYLLSREVFTCQNVRFSAYYYEDSYYAGCVELNGYAILCFQSASRASRDYLAGNLFLNLNLLFAEGEFAYFDELYSPDALVSCTRWSCGFEADYFYSSRLLGHLIFELKDDRIIRKYSYV
ncbi:MAG: ComEC/Rec2 family competence protein [Clostridiales bacterium]|nr:ComEC/Rec2 family competence protein [Clostridiales bacterium]